MKVKTSHDGVAVANAAIEQAFAEPRFTQADDGARVAYYVYGNGPEVILMLHGFNSTAEHWSSLLASFPPDEYRVIAPDMRGCGHSDKPLSGYTFERLASDAMTVIRAEGLSNFTIVGHSTGGAIAQWCAAELGAQVKSLILIGPVPATGVPVNDAARGLFQRGAHDISGRANIWKLGWHGDMDTDLLEHFMAGSRTWSPEAFLGIFDVWTIGTNFPEKLPHITAPTLVIGGAHEPFLTPDFLTEQVVSKIRGARLVMAPDCAHFIHLQQAELTAGLIRGFVAAQH
ncbi:MAG: alpha/beta fold hydrolase [Candidatus Roseilinea sp.]|uniref:alpha/beta fold hydrolase n=1 Tax=Candidatus Roseilinea sp. TaxID=2838777 RepID=UPI00404AE2AC